jgi:hypothetical protein
MLLRESLQQCATCEELTPHSRRLIAAPKWLAATALIAALWCFFQDFRWWAHGLLLVFVSIFVVLRDRERCWSIACERCRGKKRAAIRRTKPGLGANTEINIG